MSLPLQPTTVVGGYPQPDWLVDRGLLAKGVARVRFGRMWRVPDRKLEALCQGASIVRRELS